MCLSIRAIHIHKETAEMEILLFGVTRDIVGANRLSLAGKCNPSPGTVKELRQCLVDNYPELGKLSSLAVAVNKTYAREGDPLNETDEIALIPPVSGG